MPEVIPIFLETNHGVYKLMGSPEETVASVLKKAHIPLSSVWTYYLTDTHQNITSNPKRFKTPHFLPSSIKLSEAFLKYGDIFARVSRNIDILALTKCPQLFSRPSSNSTTEWIFPDSEQGSFQHVLSQLTATDCFRFILKGVEEVIDRWPTNEKPRFVVGTSGGGDSNALLSALVKSDKINNNDIFPVMMLGIPDWDSQLDQAEELCQALSLKLNVITAEEAAALVGVTSISELEHRFLQTYSDADLEFLGTWILRHVLGKYAETHGIAHVVIGANREDLVGEGLARIAQGKLPLPAPFRRIGSVNFVYPMWKVPKKIADGAFPSYSLINYGNRNPSYSRGRTIFYHLAYALSDIAPGIDLTLLEGFSQLAEIEPDPFHFESKLNDYVCKDSYTPQQIEKWQQLIISLKKHQTETRCSKAE